MVCPIVLKRTGQTIPSPLRILYNKFFELSEANEVDIGVLVLVRLLRTANDERGRIVRKWKGSRWWP